MWSDCARFDRIVCFAMTLALTRGQNSPVFPCKEEPTIATLPQPAASYMYSAQFASAPVLLTAIPGNMILRGITGRS